MFKRLLLDNLGGFVPAAGFILTAFAFLIIVIRALVMRRAEADRMARIPLETEPGKTNPPSPHVPR
ncbi:MAG: hypothetical protein JWM59_3556 [Verrucomicrobiales bacterium]|nr:hypothetical protein [Verrucomicrobiales bacterium]